LFGFTLSVNANVETEPKRGGEKRIKKKGGKKGPDRNQKVFPFRTPRVKEPKKG